MVLNPVTSKRKQLTRAIGILLLLAILATIGYLYRDAFRGTSIGQWIGMGGPTESKDVYYCPMHPDYHSDKPGDCPICNMALVKLEAGQTPVAAQDYYYCPMHPDYHSDKPGDCPICNMALVKKDASSQTPAGDTMAPGSVQISTQKQQIIGVAFGEVASGPVTHTIRTVGKVTYDETKIARIHTKIDGWIEKVHVDFVGQLVKKDQPLISIYSPELVSTQQEYLLALKAKTTLSDNRFKEISSGASSLLEASKKRLRLWDIPEAEIKRIEMEGEPIKTITLDAPVAGYVLTRNAFERQRVTIQDELYTIADLSTVWVLADIFEYEASVVKIGQWADVTLSYSPGTVFRGKVTYIYPQLDTATRALKIRLEFPNPGLTLKPDMFVNVSLAINYGNRLSIPEQAVLDSGTEQVVFVAHEGEYFEPRRVQLGAKVDDRFIVLSGLQAGERIVTSGNFLIDSESQLKSAIGGMGGQETQDSRPKAQNHAGH